MIVFRFIDKTQLHVTELNEAELFATQLLDKTNNDSNVEYMLYNFH